MQTRAVDSPPVPHHESVHESVEAVARVEVDLNYINNHRTVVARRVEMMHTDVINTQNRKPEIQGTWV